MLGKKIREVEAEGAAEARRLEKQKKSDHFWRNVFKYGDDDFVPKKRGDAERYQNELFFKNLQQTYKQIRFTSAQPKRLEKPNLNTLNQIPIHESLVPNGHPQNLTFPTHKQSSMLKNFHESVYKKSIPPFSIQRKFPLDQNITQGQLQHEIILDEDQELVNQR